MNEKPWDKLRKPVKSPIGTGSWRTRTSATILLDDFGETSVELGIGTEGAQCTMWFGPNDLRQLAEFCVELADQLEGK